MSDYHIFECDRCGQTKKGTDLPQYWAIISVEDLNRTATNDGGKYSKNFCSNCMNIVRQTMDRAPEVRPMREVA